MTPVNGSVDPIDLSVIVPALDEAEVLPGLLADLHGQQGVRLEVLVADGGSSDATAALAVAAGARVVNAPRGRPPGPRTPAALPARRLAPA